MLKETKEKHEHDERHHWNNRKESKEVPKELAVINERKMNRLLNNLQNETKNQLKDKSKIKANWKQAQPTQPTQQAQQAQDEKEKDEINSEYFLEEDTVRILFYKTKYPL